MKKTVLIVDDDPDILESLSELLEVDYDIRVAHNGREALEVVAHEPVDAVVLDMMMPVLNGEGFLVEAQRRGAPPPTIVITARADVQDRVLELGAADYLLKPFAMARLEEKLARILGPDGRGGPGTSLRPRNGGGGPTHRPGGDDRLGASDGATSHGHHVAA